MQCLYLDTRPILVAHSNQIVQTSIERILHHFASAQKNINQWERSSCIAYALHIGLYRSIYGAIIMRVAPYMALQLLIWSDDCTTAPNRARDTLHVLGISYKGRPKSYLFTAIFQREPLLFLLCTFLHFSA